MPKSKIANAIIYFLVDGFEEVKENRSIIKINAFTASGAMIKSISNFI